MRLTDGILERTGIDNFQIKIHAYNLVHSCQSLIQVAADICSSDEINDSGTLNEELGRIKKDLKLKRKAIKDQLDAFGMYHNYKNIYNTYLQKKLCGRSEHVNDFSYYDTFHENSESQSCGSSLQTTDIIEGVDALLTFTLMQKVYNTAYNN